MNTLFIFLKFSALLFLFQINTMQPKSHFLVGKWNLEKEIKVSHNGDKCLLPSKIILTFNQDSSLEIDIEKIDNYCCLADLFSVQCWMIPDQNAAIFMIKTFMEDSFLEEEGLNYEAYSIVDKGDNLFNLALKNGNGTNTSYKLVKKSANEVLIHVQTNEEVNILQLHRIG